MTKQEWFDCKDLHKLIEQMKSGRKEKLFALACCRSIEHLIQDQRSKDCLDKLELFIDGKINKKELELAGQAAWDAANAEHPLWDSSARAAWAVYAAVDVVHAVSTAVKAIYYTADWSADAKVTNVDTANDDLADADADADTADAEERAKQIEFLRDIYNPFIENIIFSHEAKSIAQQVYDGDHTARLILSDYLEEHKFPEELYLHLKQPNHYKGCWVIDQILEKS